MKKYKYYIILFILGTIYPVYVFIRNDNKLDKLEIYSLSIGTVIAGIVFIISYYLWGKNDK